MAESEQDYDNTNDVLVKEAKKICDSLGLDSVRIFATMTNGKGERIGFTGHAGDYFTGLGCVFEWVNSRKWDGS